MTTFDTLSYDDWHDRLNKTFYRNTNPYFVAAMTLMEKGSEVHWKTTFLDREVYCCFRVNDVAVDGKDITHLIYGKPLDVKEDNPVLYVFTSFYDYHWYHSYACLSRQKKYQVGDKVIVTIDRGDSSKTKMFVGVIEGERFNGGHGGFYEIRSLMSGRVEIYGAACLIPLPGGL